MGTRAVDRLLLVVLVLALLTASAGAVVGLTMIGEDLETQGEWLDGLGLMFGLAVLGVVAVPALVAGKALHDVRRGREGAWRWALAAGVVGLLAVVPFGVFAHPSFAVAVVPFLLVVVALEARKDATRRGGPVGGSHSHLP